MSENKDLLIANILIDYFKKQSLHYDEYLEYICFKYSSDRNAISKQIADQLKNSYGNVYIYGLFEENLLNLDSIVSVLPVSLAKTTTLLELNSIVSWLKLHRIMRIEIHQEFLDQLISKDTKISGYCLIDDSKILGAEFNGNDPEKIKLMNQILNLRQDLEKAKIENLKIQEKFTNLQNTLETQDAILSNKISLSWS